MITHELIKVICIVLASIASFMAIKELLQEDDSNIGQRQKTSREPYKIKELDPIPQGSLVRVIVPDDPLFRSEWDGMMGVVTGVEESGKWYRVMFSTRDGLKFQIFKRHDLKWMGELR